MAMTSSTSPACVFCDNEKALSRVRWPDDPDPTLTITPAREHRLQIEHTYVSRKPLEEWQIRILELQPSADRGPLVARIFNADILFSGGVVESGTNSRHEYQAISYYWGDRRDPRYRLRCNGVDYPISREAYRALYRIRDSRDPVYVWIDTVCINQHDLAERETQVPKMRSIYQQAQKVVVYLGEHIPQSPRVSCDAATRGAAFLFDLLEDFHYTRYLGRDLDDDTMTRQIRKAAPTGHAMCDSHAAMIEAGVRAISQRPWFNRVWVKQEVWAARHVDVQLGNTTLPWQTLKSFRKCMKRIMPFLNGSQTKTLQPLIADLSEKLDRLPVATPIAHAATEMDDKPNPDLEDTEEFEQDIVNVLRRSENAECSRVHDRIYGLLGMTSVNVRRPNGRPEKTFEVSYQTHPAQMFTELARYIVGRDECFNILLLEYFYRRTSIGVSIVDENGVQKHLPSWVPDWRSAIGHIADCDPNSFELPEAQWRSYPSNTLPSTSLHIKGLCFGKVSGCFKREEYIEAEIEWTAGPLTSTMSGVPAATKAQDVVVRMHWIGGLVLLRPTVFPRMYEYIGPFDPVRSGVNLLWLMVSRDAGHDLMEDITLV